MSMEYHLAHIKEEGSTAVTVKAAQTCEVCITHRQKLKGKYRNGFTGQKHKSTIRTSAKAPKVGLAALMQNAQAIKNHYIEAFVNGHYEQIPKPVLLQLKGKYND